MTRSLCVLTEMGMGHEGAMMAGSDANVKPQRRRFNRSERIALYLASDGKCTRCGRDLEPGWHGDHIIPSVAGGPTDVINGQALCVTCNLQKGRHMSDFLTDLFLSAWHSIPRDWQIAAFEKLIAAITAFRLINVTPGGGKTKFACAYAKFLLSIGRIRRVIVIVPTINLKGDWQKAMAEAGIQLDKDFDAKFALCADFQGAVVCYQSVFIGASSLRRLCTVPTLVIFDEIHHLKDQDGWGLQAEAAFGGIADLLMMGTTGTAFRSDGFGMAFVKFDASGQLITDFDYPYRQALRDGVVRLLSFPTWNATLIKYIKDGSLFDVDFDPRRSREDWDQALRGSVHPDSDFLRDMIRDANVKLQSRLLRGQSDPAAAGIFFGNRIEELDYIQKRCFKPLGVKSLVIHSKNDDPTEDLERAKDDHSIEWVLAVRMLSEGVNLNRARVSVHGTCSTSALQNEQMDGRIIRRGGPHDAEAFKFFPKHPILVQQAIEKMKDRIYVLRGPKDVCGPGSKKGPRPEYFFIEGHGIASDHIVYENSFRPDQIRYALDMVNGADLAPVVSEQSAARLLHKAGALQASPFITQAPPRVVQDERDEVRARINKLVSRAALALVRAGKYSDDKAGKEEAHRYVRNNELSPLDGVFNDSGKILTLAQLKRREARMIEYLKELSRAHRTP